MTRLKGDIAEAVRATVEELPGPRRRGVPKPLTADRQGFSVNAAVACTAQQRSKLERIARASCTNQGHGLASI